MGLLALCVGWAAFIQYAVVYRTYTRLEQRQAMEDIQRCVDAIREAAYYLDVTASDWASWDDTYRFMEDRNPEYKNVNLNRDSMETVQLNLLCLVDTSGAVVWYSALDSMTKAGLQLNIFSQSTLPLDHPLLTLERQESLPRIIQTEHGVMLVASKPILQTGSQGQPRGTLIMGRFFSDANVERLIQQTHVPFVAWNLSSSTLPTKIQEVKARGSFYKPLIEPEPEADRLQGYTVLKDIFGQPALLVNMTIPRTITALGRESALYACIGLLAVLAIVWATLFAFLNRYVVWPILRLRYRTTMLNPDSHLSQRIPVQRNDEIGSLAMAFNALLDRLDEERKPRRQPGMPVQEAHLAETRI
jgi:sensor domain CHASE-containing protein